LLDLVLGGGVALVTPIGVNHLANTEVPPFTDKPDNPCQFPRRYIAKQSLFLSFRWQINIPFIFPCRILMP